MPSHSEACQAPTKLMIYHQDQTKVPDLFYNSSQKQNSNTIQIQIQNPSLHTDTGGGYGPPPH